MLRPRRALGVKHASAHRTVSACPSPPRPRSGGRGALAAADFGPCPAVVQSALYTQAVPETTAQICVRVRLFASYREAAGTNRLETPLPSGATVRELTDLLAAKIPGLKAAPG